MDCSPPGSSVHGILQARILEWVVGDLPDPGTESASPTYPALAGRFFTTEPPGKPGALKVGSSQGRRGPQSLG